MLVTHSTIIDTSQISYFYEDEFLGVDLHKVVRNTHLRVKLAQFLDFLGHFSETNSSWTSRQWNYSPKVMY